MQFFRFMTIGIMTLVFGGCAFQSVPERLPVYFGPDKDLLSGSSLVSIPSEGVKAGLLVINDTTYPDSAPALSDEGIQGFTARLKAQLGKRFPITVVKEVDSRDFTQGKNSRQFVQVAEKEEVDYLLLAVLSSSEVEVPGRFPFQGGQLGGGIARGNLLGFRAENYALVELALINGQTGHPLVNANGRAWSSLERLNVPIESNVYPVVRRDLTQPPIYPTDETAYDTLRVVSADDAMQQALMHFQEAWNKEAST